MTDDVHRFRDKFGTDVSVRPVSDGSVRLDVQFGGIGQSAHLTRSDAVAFAEAVLKCAGQDPAELRMVRDALCAAYGKAVAGFDEAFQAAQDSKSNDPGRQAVAKAWLRRLIASDSADGGKVAT